MLKSEIMITADDGSTITFEPAPGGNVGITIKKGFQKAQYSVSGEDFEFMKELFRFEVGGPGRHRSYKSL